MQLRAAAEQLGRAARDSVAVRLDVDDQNPRATALVMALSRLAAPAPTCHGPSRPPTGSTPRWPNCSGPPSPRAAAGA